MIDIKILFNNLGIKHTKQRILVYEILRKALIPISAEEIYQKYIENDKTISLSTIYRILELFSKKDIIIKTYIQSKACYKLNSNEHKHFLICLDCKKIIEIDSCPFHDYETELEKTTNFTVTSHKLELYGYCPKCKLFSNAH